MKTSGTLFWGVDYVVSVNGGAKILGDKRIRAEVL